MIRARITTILALVCLVQIAPVRAADSDRYDGLEPRDKFKIRLGVFLADDYDTSLRLNSNRFLLGGLIDFEDNLNLDSNSGVWRLDGFYRFNERHRMSFNIYSSRRDGKAIAGRDFTVGNPDGLLGISIPVGTQVKTTLDYDLLKLGYGYSFVNRRKFEATIGAGVNFRKLDFEIAWQANVGERVRGNSIKAEDWVPLPTVGLGGRWNFTEKLEANIRLEVFYLEFDNYEGYYDEMLINLEHRTFDHFGFGLGVNYGNLNLRGKDDDVRGELDSRIFGLLGYAKYYF